MAFVRDGPEEKYGDSGVRVGTRTVVVGMRWGWG